MNSRSSSGVTNPEITLVLTYVPPSHRAAITALFMIDSAMGEAMRAARQPLIGQMRLTWWHDALHALDTQAAPAAPVLRAVARDLVQPGVLTGAALSSLVSGWEALLDDNLNACGLKAYAQERGGVLFGLASRVLQCDHPDMVAAGSAWALADFARHASTRTLAAQALAAAVALPRAAARWPRALRAFGALEILARRDALRGAGRIEPQATPKRMLLALGHRFTGAAAKA